MHQETWPLRLIHFVLGYAGFLQDCSTLAMTVLWCSRLSRNVSIPQTFTVYGVSEEKSSNLTWKMKWVSFFLVLFCVMRLAKLHVKWRFFSWVSWVSRDRELTVLCIGWVYSEVDSQVSKLPGRVASSPSSLSRLQNRRVISGVGWVVKEGLSTHSECHQGHLEGLEEARIAQSLSLQNHSQVRVIGPSRTGMHKGPAAARSSPHTAKPLGSVRYNCWAWQRLSHGAFRRNALTAKSDVLCGRKGTCMSTLNNAWLMMRVKAEHGMAHIHTPFSRKLHKISRTRELCFWISNFTPTFAGLFYVISDPKLRTSERDIAYPKNVPTSF
jgi:hypothetical protein